MAAFIQLIEGPFGALLMVVGGLLTIVAIGLWLPVVAFMQKWWWGLLVFFIPGAFVVFSFLYWPVAKRPFLIGIISLIITLGVYLLRAFFGLYFVSPDELV